MRLAQTTQALVLRENGAPLELETLEVAAPSSHQVLVELCATGIGHTDLTCASKNVPFPTPSILGHEGAGVVVAVGGALEGKFSAGDTVVLSFNFCGTCHSCANDHPAYCKSFRSMNAPCRRADGTASYTSTNLVKNESIPVLGGFFGQSSFAKFALVEENCVVSVQDVAAEELPMFAPLGCGIQTGAGCVINTLRVPKGASFAIFGAGAVGLSALIAAKTAGADPIIAVDLVEERLSIAKELGATHTINGTSNDAVEEIRKITSATQGVSYAIDATGVIDVIESMINALGTMGKAATVGISCPGAKINVDSASMMGLGKTLTGCIEGDCVPQKFIPFLISEFRSGRFPLEKLVKVFPVAQFRDAMEDMATGKTIKPVLKWN